MNNDGVHFLLDGEVRGDLRQPALGLASKGLSVFMRLKVNHQIPGWVSVDISDEDIG